MGFWSALSCFGNTNTRSNTTKSIDTKNCKGKKGGLGWRSEPNSKANKLKQKNCKIIRVDENDCPKQSLLKLAKQGRFDEINSILLQDEHLDIETWLQQALDTSKVMNHWPKLGERRHWMGSFPERPPKNQDKLTTLNDRKKGVNRKVYSKEYVQGWNRNLKEDNIFHVLVSYRPPWETIELIAKWIAFYKTENYMAPNTPPEYCKNEKGQTPLHLAVKYGCDIAVVERFTFVPTLIMERSASRKREMVEKYKMLTSPLPAMSLDTMKRCPLHYACSMVVPISFQIKRYSNSSSSTASTEQQHIDFHENMVAVIELLLKAFPEGVNIEDINEQTPLDLARKNISDKRILLKLFQVANMVDMSINGRVTKSLKHVDYKGRNSLDIDRNNASCNTSSGKEITSGTGTDSSSSLEEDETFSTNPVPQFVGHEYHPVEENPKSAKKKEVDNHPVPLYVGHQHQHPPVENVEVANNQQMDVSCSVLGNESVLSVASGGDMSDGDYSEESSEWESVGENGDGYYSDSISSIGDCGASTFLPNRAKFENRTLFVL